MKLNYLKHIILSLTFFFILLSVKASNHEYIAHWLKNEGFENIQINEINDTLILSYENRIFRHEAAALAYIIKNITDFHKNTLIILPKYLNITMLQLRIEKQDFVNYQKNRISPQEFAEKIIYSLATDHYKSEGQSTNSSLFKADVLLEPKLSFQLGNYDRPIQALIELAPTLQIQLRRGLQVNTQILIPLFNNLRSMEGVTVRTGMINLSQNFKLPDNFFVTASAGIFTYDRLGVDLKTKKYFLNGHLAISTQMSYTTWTELAHEINNRYFNKDNYFIGRIGAEYRYAKYDLLIGASYGSFLYQDKGWRFDIYRQFNELIIGFVGIKTTDDYNAGFYLSIPLMPRKNKQIKKIRLRPSHYFKSGYNFRGSTYTGKNYSTGNNIINRSREFNPYYIKNQLIELLKN